MTTSPLAERMSEVSNLQAVAFFLSPVGSPHCAMLIGLGR